MLKVEQVEQLEELDLAAVARVLRKEQNCVDQSLPVGHAEEERKTITVSLYGFVL